MSKIKSVYVLADVLKFLPMRKVLQVITYSKSLHETLGIKKEERSLLKRIYTTPLAPLNYTCRFSKKSGHINGFLYNKLKDYKSFIEEQSENIKKETFDKNFINYLKSLKSDFVCMIDLNDQEGLELARQLPNLKFGLFLDYATNTQNVDLTGINLTYLSENLEKLNKDVRTNLLTQLQQCKGLDTLKITVPTELDVPLMQNLPKVRKLQLVNNWKTADELVNALKSLPQMGDKTESLTIYTFYKVWESRSFGPIKEALSNFKKVKSLYFRMSINEVVSYQDFCDIFSSFAPTLEKLKFDLDIFDPKQNKEPITFKEFPKLKKVIIKNEKPNQCIYDLSKIPYYEIKYPKVPVHKGNIEALKEPVQGLHIVFDKEGFSEAEEKEIINTIKKDTTKYVSIRGINCTIKQIIPTFNYPNVQQLSLNTVLGDWSMDDLLQNNIGLQSLELIGLGNPSPEHIKEIPQSNICFPNVESQLKSLYIKRSIISEVQNMLTYCKNIKSLTFNELKLKPADYIYLCEHIGELKNLESLGFGKIELIENLSNPDDFYVYIGKFFENLSKIPGIKCLDFDSNLRLELNFLQKLGKHIGHFKNLEYFKLSVLEPKDSFEARKIILQETEKLHKIKTFKLIMFENL